MCSKPALYENYDRCTANNLPWEEKGDDFYEATCILKERRILVDSEDKRHLIISKGVPVYPVNRNSRGRALSAPVPELGLERGDRLEPGWDPENPSSILSNQIYLETAMVPFVVVFWRASFDPKGKLMDGVVRRCPIFDQRLGTSPVRTLALDSLHAFYFGAMSRFASCVLWRLVVSTPWGFRGEKAIVDVEACR